jgi:hypothetical protein
VSDEIEHLRSVLAPPTKRSLILVKPALRRIKTVAWPLQVTLQHGIRTQVLMSQQHSQALPAYLPLGLPRDDKRRDVTMSQLLLLFVGPSSLV